MCWSFGQVNGRLAEVFFEKGKKVKFIGHAFVKKSEYSTEREQEWIENDTAKVQLLYRNGEYVRIYKSDR